jgi:acyl-coenzyme A thioesterase PaaI-like protein
VTDIPSPGRSVPGRLGVTARMVDGRFVIDLTPQPETLHHGYVRASVLAYAVDVVAGIAVDLDDSVWTLTTDLSVRARPMPAPDVVCATGTVVRRGRRSVTCAVELVTGEGDPVGTGAVGFAYVPRKEGEPAKHVVRPEDAVELFGEHLRLSAPLRDEAGIETCDAANGVVQVELMPELLNPAGTLQGAMVALVAEAAAEDLLEARFDTPAVVTDLDIRYLARTEAGPVRSRTRLIGDGPDAPIEVQLVDLSTDTVTTLVYARAVAAR